MNLLAMNDLVKTDDFRVMNDLVALNYFVIHDPKQPRHHE